MNQPLDMDPTFNAIAEAFPVGTKFSQLDVYKLTQLPFHIIRRGLTQIREALADCPEGVQLFVRRGAGGHHMFVNGETD